MKGALVTFTPNQEEYAVKKIMTRSMFTAVVLALGLSAAFAGDKEKTKCADPAKCAMASKLLKGVVHLEHDDIRFIRKEGGIVFVDPMVKPEAAKESAPWFGKPDLILITHAHWDHFQPDVIKAYQKVNPEVVLAGPADVVELAKEKGIWGMKTVVPNQDYQFGDFSVSTVPAYFEDPEMNHPQENNWVGYVLSINGARYYVSGDTQALPAMAQVEADVVFPLLYGCGGNSDQALKMAALTGAQMVVPVHHGGEKATLKAFLARIPDQVQRACFLEGHLVAGL